MQLQVLHAESAPDINALDKVVVINTDGVSERNPMDLLAQAIDVSLVERQKDLAVGVQKVQHELQAGRSPLLIARKPLEDEDETRSSVDAPLGTVQQELPTCEPVVIRERESLIEIHQLARTTMWHPKYPHP